MKIPVLYIACVFAFVATSSSFAAAEKPLFASLKELNVPAAEGAREPNLFAMKDGRVLLTWTEPAGKGFAVRLAIGDEKGWSEARTVTEGDNLFVNWADFPSAIALGDGTLVAHWLKVNGASTYAYDVNIALSKDNGRSWSKPLVPHRDFTERQHGFVSLLPVSSNDLMAIWLDGRNYSSAGSFAAATEPTSDAMALRSTRIGSDGTMSEDKLLDPRTCTCCQTSAAVAASGTVVVAYRDRTEEEIRDISVVRLVDGQWSQSATVHRDGWHIAGCPVNGPAVDANGKNVAVAWFTAAGGAPRVQVAFSGDEGAIFGNPIRVDRGSPAGRVDLLLLNDGSALVSWLELTSLGEELLVCRVAPNAPCGQPKLLSLSREGRTSGFPRMVRSGDRVYFAWTQPSRQRSSSPGSGLKVRTVVAKLNTSH